MRGVYFLRGKIQNFQNLSDVMLMCAMKLGPFSIIEEVMD